MFQVIELVKKQNLKSQEAKHNDLTSRIQLPNNQYNDTTK